MRRRAAESAALALAGAAIGVVLVADLAGALDGTDPVVRGFVSLSVVTAACAGSGAAIAWHRPRNIVGWSLLGAGTVAAVSLAAIVLLPYAVAHTWPIGAQAAVAQVILTLWTALLALTPLTVLAFPGGRLDGTADRILAGTAVVAWLILVLFLLADPQPWTALTGFGVSASAPLVTTPALGLLAAGPLTSIAIAGTAAAFAAFGIIVLGVLAVVVVRFARGDVDVRRQLLWVLIASGIAIALTATHALPLLFGPEAGGALSPAVFALIPLAIAVASARGDAFGLQDVFGRTLTWVLATGVVVSAYAILVAALTTLLAASTSAVLAAIAVAIAFEPVRRRLQRLADRVTRGPRTDAQSVLGAFGAELSAGHDLDGVLERLRAALRLDGLLLQLPDGSIAGRAGDTSGIRVTLPLRYDGADTGSIEYSDDIGRLRDIRPALDMIAPVLAAVTRLTVVARQLSESRGMLVLETERERRRLQRDLHDDVSAVLGGVAFKLEALRMRMTDTALLQDVHDDVLRVGRTLRAVIEDLAPPELELLGLDGALRQAVGTSQSVTLTVDSAGPLPPAVELAIYRIVLEAVANSLRHAQPDGIDVSISRDGRRVQIVVDDHVTTHPSSAAPGIGVGLASMRERAEVLGGTFDAGPTIDGWRVAATIPVAADV